MMSKKRLIVLSLISLIFLAKILWGQELLSDRWWYSQNLAKKLNLTAEMIRALEQLHLDSHRQLNQLKSVVEDADFELDNLLGQKSMLDDEVRMQFERLEDARAHLANQRLRLAVRLREIIGDDRFEQLKTAYEKLH